MIYSVNNERYTDYNDLMSDLREHYQIGETVEVWEADVVPYKHSNFINVDDLIYTMQSDAVDNCGEVAEEYLDQMSNTQKSELARLIANWFDENVEINFHGVENEHKIMVVVE